MNITIGLLLIYFFSGSAIIAGENWIDSDAAVADTLIISADERERLISLEKQDVLTIRPVALPVGKYLAGENHHLGWPVGIKVGDTLLCAYHQTLRHHGDGPREDENSSRAIVVRSTDGGESWSDPIDVTQFGKNTEKLVLGFGNCFGLLNNKLFLATTYGLYRSEDEGITWTLLPDALTEKQTGHNYGASFGPRMIIHPEMGLVIAAGVTRTPFIDMYHSKDEGMTWVHERFPLSDTIHPLEPTAMYHDGRLIFVSRNHILPFRGHGLIKVPQPPVMMVSDTGWFPMTHRDLSNISSYRWPDTTDVDFNPVTKRYEAVVTNRSGGALNDEQNEEHEQTVNLWSLSKRDMYAGRADKWRLEATLLRLESGMLELDPENIDAAHPGGGVIDEARGVQHIFIYCGKYATPSGIYRITRDLDTKKLRKAVGAIR